jgi:hypothetical protein
MDALEDLSRDRVVAIALASVAGLPALFRLTPAAGQRTLEFFTANIRNGNTRKAYARAVENFAA